MTMPVHWWKRIAIGVLVLFVGYEFVWPRLVAGSVALNYINRCIEVGACPSSTVLWPPAPAAMPPARPTPEKSPDKAAEKPAPPVEKK